MALLAGGFIWVAFTLTAAFEWFLSSRPKLFVRLFVRRDEQRATYRTLLRNPDRQRAHRRAAIVQFALSTFAALAALLYTWLG